MLGSPWTKLAAFGAIVLSILVAIGQIFRAGQKAEISKNKAAVAEAQTQALEDVKDVEADLDSLSADERRERLRRDASDFE